MSGNWQADKELASAMLTDRATRRRLLGAGLLLILAMMGLGLWVLAEWLVEAWWRFALWWGGCGLLTIWVLLFALYDALMSIRESRK